MSARSPEETHDEGAGEQSDEGQAVTQRGQNLHHPVEELHKRFITACSAMEDIGGVFTGTFKALENIIKTHTHIYVDTNLVQTLPYWSCAVNHTPTHTWISEILQFF